MKTNLITVALSFLTLAAVAQKDQVKNAEDAIDDKNYAEAKAQLKIAEPNVSSLKEKYQEEFYLYKGQAYMGDNPTSADMKIAAQAFQKASEMGNEDATEALMTLKNDMIQAAIQDQNNEKFAEAAEKLYTSYELSKEDTIYLYYAANNLVQAQDYDKAVEYLEMLNELDYDGSGIEYTAVNAEGTEETFSSAGQRDLMIKTGNYTNPGMNKIPSKKGDIAQLIARIYISQKDYDKAVAAMDKAKATNPDDITLLQAEANMYYQMGEKEKARQLFEKIAETNTDDPVTFNNIGIMYGEVDETEKAIENYEKALAIDPNYNDARLNLIAAILGSERAIIEEMNGLGMSKKDNARYEELDAQRKALYTQVVPYLEKALEVEPNNIDVLKTSMNIYSNLGNTEKVEEMKSRLEQ
ncbi:tetratricopeptide repeat protein [Gramella sp. AN32]|uniref:Tetratricopeptide repeat protein n=1 Tax=Christiangramia antarctica TaxID=2058158 RepID=A0ABW5XB22_9FLAO|nr:tetratricopeptide repeat protein [Gramella sp. AN32]MCM4157386.1 hypothetical protein [Gramella sp. AN32]